MSKNKKNVEPQQQEVVEAVSKFESFFSKYKNVLLYTIIGIAVVIALFFAYKSFVLVPKQKEAQNQMFTAERFFRNGSYETALKGDGNAMGFQKIIKEYGKKAGEAAYMYAGICELQLGNNDSAISYLKKYNGKDKIMLGRATACIGDAYVNKGDNASAVVYFKKAAEISENIFSAAYLLKAGISYEEMNKKDDALKMYEKIKYEYPQSIEGYQIDKYISRIKTEQSLSK